ncbi:P-loop containing nucleoside triphosphate hydrolase protein [Lasiosphaeria miniovina]|uniref:P-loop containing nucleoside triphosphate hydrolase protein n=1 Tax=Lasiosphaeria miniovina TaxID=1954250 RepID=A0AA40AK03_9PEZI|nr:P-loop containing nucleoside triphosphate hydrolase protein [Lasiosphaeria miniovina]KAK0717286.1 P-loop containing nucleoside triphosphate hydrolase protein [Lasiosphaeria miniovina]
MATQMRISSTKGTLDSMKNIKMMGLVDKMEAKIQSVRDDEISKFIRFYRLLVAFFVSSIALAQFTPAITLVVYAIQAQLRGERSIDVNMAFTSLAIIELVTSPTNELLSILPEGASILVAFGRIQTYLLGPSREDKRALFNEMRYIRSGINYPEGITLAGLESRTGKLVVVCGVVGSGKTTLVKALLGDLPLDSGVIHTAFRSTAYCSQTAWLINGTIKEAIRGPPGDDSAADDSAADEEWYRRVTYACDLVEDFEQMPSGDDTIIGSRGIILSGGQKQRVALARAVYARRDFIILDDVLSALDATTERHIVINLLSPKGLFKELSTTVLLITHATQHLPLADLIIVLDTSGKILEQGTWEELRAHGGYVSKVVLKEKEGGENKPHDRAEARDKIQLAPEQPDSKMQDMTRTTGDVKLYGYYFSAIGLARLSVLLCSLMSYAVLFALVPYWLKWLTEAEVMHAPQSYFAKTDTGTTLNRFSTDMMMLNRRLPLSLFQVCQALFRILSQCILLAVVQPLITATLHLTVLAVFLIQKVYLTRSRQLRFLDLEARAMVNASFLETFEGVATIRAFSWQRQFIRDNTARLDLSLRPDYMLVCIQRWLDMVLDLMVPGLAMGVIGLAVALKGTNTGGQIGIALNVVLKLNMSLLRLVDAWTQLETSLGAISRLRALEQDVQPEDGVGKLQPPPPLGWPTHGLIQFSRVSASYKPPVLALDNLDLSIPPGTKVGVVGRTGSGKSSLLLTLLRLVEMEGEDGTIRIDGLDLRELPRNAVRARIITVPQEPMLVMTDTVRQNLDIAASTDTKSVSDDDMIRVLQRVRLWDVLQSRAASVAAAGREVHKVNAAMGLVVGSNSGSSSRTTTPTPGSDDDDEIDADKKSLFSLARVLLMRGSRGRVVLLDEATSSVDGATDRLMQALVGAEFKDHTVITVAHRLDTIMDSDVVLVLDAGKLVEAGPPAKLASKEGRRFRALICGKRTA